MMRAGEGDALHCIDARHARAHVAWCGSHIIAGLHSNGRQRAARVAW